MSKVIFILEWSYNYTWSKVIIILDKTYTLYLSKLILYTSVKLYLYSKTIKPFSHLFITLCQCNLNGPFLKYFLPLAITLPYNFKRKQHFLNHANTLTCPTYFIHISLKNYFNTTTHIHSLHLTFFPTYTPYHYTHAVHIKSLSITMQITNFIQI